VSIEKSESFINWLQIGYYPSPASSFLMHKASIEFYMKALTPAEILEHRQLFLNGTIFSDSCYD